jgi:RimJ/RimL family protein N-acetyltransferase
MKSYKILDKKIYTFCDFSIVPIRYEDRFDIMNWRNDQIYHLRQDKELTIEDQEKYFIDIVEPLFNEKEPSQILFSFLHREQCIGYGGLVHINWIDKNAEISFILNPKFEIDFIENWCIFLSLIEKVGFAEIGLHKLYTYAFDLRPNLYIALEKSSYTREAVLKQQKYFKNHFIDVIIHCKFKN